jgi:hypothetical protein
MRELSDRGWYVWKPRGQSVTNLTDCCFFTRLLDNLTQPDIVANNNNHVRRSLNSTQPTDAIKQRSSRRVGINVDCRQLRRDRSVQAGCSAGGWPPGRHELTMQDPHPIAAIRALTELMASSTGE